MNRLLLAALLSFTFTSCFICGAPGVTPHDAKNDLQLCDESYVGLLGWSRFEGKIENTGNRKIGNIIVEATLKNGNGDSIGRYCIHISEPLTPYGRLTFSDKTYVADVKQISLRITSAAYQ